ncbi:hypothetical protein PoB_006500100 [Plakobranchus ocellatus]|uniref:Uncharacterized protein n=1 Tax=Plakobranchus ocellatus TaxID=259542 RepID=A0AAV4D336_9GAST|nr:hypothetical protein PoB_006500100 [Plakobranchus ocellatus]
MDRKNANELVLKEANHDRSLIKTIRQRQLQFLGRHKGLEYSAITGKIEGKRNRGRQRTSFIESLKSWAIGKGSNNNFTRHLRIGLNGGTCSPMSVPNKVPDHDDNENT